MKLLLDHTSLHSVGRSIQHRATGEPDLAGLLQLATQLVFAEKIALSNVDSGGVISESRGILSKLRHYGVDESIFSFFGITQEEFQAASIRAAKKLAADLKFVLPNNRLAPEGLLPTAKPNLDSKLQQHEDRVHKVVLSGSENSREDLLHESLDPEYLGSAAYMLTKSDDLWSSVQQIVSMGNWGKKETEHLGVYLRFYLNEQLAGIIGKGKGTSYEYAPAVSRSRIVNKYSAYVINKLSESVGEAAKALEPVLLGAPSVSSALVLRSKGDPLGLISEALNAREKAKNLRELLSKSIQYQKTNDDGVIVDIHEQRQTIAMLSKTLRQDLGIEERPRLRDAFELQFLGLVPIPSVNRLIDWFVFKKNQKSIAILSEFAKSLVDFKGEDQFAYQKLEANARKNL